MQGELKVLADLALFAKIVQAGGISRCAGDLGMERTSISRRLGALEALLGVKLINRSSRELSVTHAGLRCLKQCELLLETAQSARSLATDGVAIANSGSFVLGAPPDIINKYLEPKIAIFESRNEGIRIERRPTTVWTKDAVASVDVGVALAPLDIADGWTKTIARVRQSIYASTDYVANHTPVKSPFDLMTHDSIVESCYKDVHMWRFERNEKCTTVTINGTHVVPSLLEAREATLAGLGISRLPQYLCEPYVHSGALTELVPDAECISRDIVLISPRHRQPKLGTTALRIYLETAFGTEIL